MLMFMYSVLCWCPYFGVYLYRLHSSDDHEDEEEEEEEEEDEEEEEEDARLEDDRPSLQLGTKGFQWDSTPLHGMTGAHPSDSDAEEEPEEKATEVNVHFLMLDTCYTMVVVLAMVLRVTK